MPWIALKYNDRDGKVYLLTHWNTKLSWFPKENLFFNYLFIRSVI
jgi:hypothetical protein